MATAPVLGGKKTVDLDDAVFGLEVNEPLLHECVKAEAAARRALKLVEPTDLVTQHANALLMLADALEARGLGADAAAARGEAIAKLRAKGNLAAVARLGG